MIPQFQVLLCTRGPPQISPGVMLRATCSMPPWRRQGLLWALLLTLLTLLLLWWLRCCCCRRRRTRHVATMMALPAAAVLKFADRPGVIVGVSSAMTPIAPATDDHSA
jgi:hypothetical protein